MRESPITRIRQSAGLSRKGLAEKAGIACSTIYLLEDGLTDMHVSTLLKLATALGVSPGSLLNPSPPPVASQPAGNLRDKSTA